MAYFGDWSSKEDVKASFDICEDMDLEILFAIYHDPFGYSGEAFVIGLDEQGAPFFVEGSHCSCYALEGQWKPEAITAATLRHMDEQGYQFNYLPEEARTALKSVIESLA